jgi:nitrilase
MPTTLRAAVVQAAPVAFDTERTLDRLTDLTARAAAEGAQLVVYPEAFVGGYPKGADFGARVGSRSPEGRDWFRRYAAGAIEVPGPAVERLGRWHARPVSCSSWASSSGPVTPCTARSC